MLNRNPLRTPGIAIMSQPLLGWAAGFGSGSSGRVRRNPYKGTTAIKFFDAMGSKAVRTLFELEIEAGAWLGGQWSNGKNHSTWGAKSRYGISTQRATQFYQDFLRLGNPFSYGAHELKGYKNR